MYCTKCGAENADDSAFCRKCGGELDVEQETRVAVRDADDKPERTIFSIGPTQKFVKLGYGAAVVGAFILVAVVSIFVPTLSPFTVIPIALALLLIPAFFHLQKKMVKYTLTESTVEVDEGLIARRTRSIPLRRIQDITVSAGLSQRMLGFGDIVIDNAGRDGERIVLKDVNSPRKYADEMLRQLRRLDR